MLENVHYKHYARRDTDYYRHRNVDVTLPSGVITYLHCEYIDYIFIFVHSSPLFSIIENGIIFYIIPYCKPTVNHERVKNVSFIALLSGNFRCGMKSFFGDSFRALVLYIVYKSNSAIS